ncbi:MAG: flagellar basal body P-ring formation protein FlgA [Rhizobacter sp.]|nr:flagellar basal body P-ring formation protein FlgA [Rhizobacter sp.]
MNLLGALVCASLGIAAVFSLPTAATAAALQVDLKPHARASADVVKLGEVAQIRSSDTALAQLVADLTLGSAPLAGDSMNLSGKRVASWLARQASLKGHAWSMTGAPSVSIERASQTLAGAEMEAAAQEFIDHWLRGQAEEHEAKVTTAVSAANIPAGQWVLQARAWAADLQPSRQMRVWLDVVIAGRTVRAIPVDFHVRAHGQRWVLRRDVAPGQTVTEADAMLEMTDLTRLQGPTLTRSPVGETLKAHARAGQVLMARQVEARPAVERGSDVTMHSKAGLISLTTTARALQSGQPGQRIRVQPAGARTWVEAQVVSTALVEVTP